MIRPNKPCKLWFFVWLLACLLVCLGDRRGGGSYGFQKNTLGESANIFCFDLRIFPDQTGARRAVSSLIPRFFNISKHQGGETSKPSICFSHLEKNKSSSDRFPLKPTGGKSHLFFSKVKNRGTWRALLLRMSRSQMRVPNFACEL